MAMQPSNVKKIGYGSSNNGIEQEERLELVRLEISSLSVIIPSRLPIFMEHIFRPNIKPVDQEAEKIETNQQLDSLPVSDQQILNFRDSCHVSKTIWCK